MSAMMMEDPEQIKTFIEGSNATLTLVSKETGVRYTYKIRKINDDAPFFVSKMTGSDNEKSYQYMGIYNPHNYTLNLTRKSNFTKEQKETKAFQFFLKNLSTGKVSSKLEVWHEGRCGRCNRKLTVPESIESGFGPNCLKLNS